MAILRKAILAVAASVFIWLIVKSGPRLIAREKSAKPPGRERLSRNWTRKTPSG